MQTIGHPGGARAPGRVSALLLCAVALACLLGGGAGVARAQDQSPLDTVIQGSTATAKAATATTSSVSTYPVAGGQSVRVDVDPAYAGTDALTRVLGTLGATVHGDEMNKLTVHIADADNLNRLCGQNSTACYFPSSMTMVVSGNPVNPNNQMPQGMVITHEYGHHIEANRSYAGWNASNLGARHWATYEHVCEGVAAGQLYPGDEGLHYWENPGEAFAQAYATMLYPNGAPWWWSFAEPDQGAFDAIRADVADTSKGNKVTWSQTLNGATPTATSSFNTNLDGPISVNLRQPRKGRFSVTLLSPGGNVLSHGITTQSWKGKRSKKGKKANSTSESELDYSSCGSGSRSFTVQVSRISGRGKFTAEILRP